MQIFVADGFIATDIERYDNGKVITAKFSIAIRSGYGENSRTDFFPVACFDKVAENVIKYKKKGDYLLVRGTLKNVVYETKEGKKSMLTNIIAQEIGYGHTTRAEKAERVKTEYSQTPFEESELPTTPDELDFPPF